MIPFNKPVLLGTEAAAIQAALSSGHTGGGGPFGRVCEQHLERLLGQRALLVTSATHALELSAHLLGLGPGDEVILPSFTFVSTANAFVLRGARPVFADVDGSGNLDVAEVARLIGPRTRAIAVVHYAGNSCDLDALREVAGNIPLVEDAALAFGSAFDGKPLGTFGACGIFSFHETKNVGCGEGGALTLRDPALIERAEWFRDKGTNRRQFLDGLVDKYTWVSPGSSLGLSDLNAAWLSTQLVQLQPIAARRKILWERYQRALQGPAEHAGAALLPTPPRNTPNHHLFALVFAQAAQRSAFIAFMRGHGITTTFHYLPLHSSAMGRPLHDGRELPATDRFATCLVRLPLFFNLTDAEQQQVIDRATEFLGRL